jgi:uncharacterized protein
LIWIKNAVVFSGQLCRAQPTSASMNPKHLACALALLFFLSFPGYAQDTLRVPNVEAILYTGRGSNQPLVVGLGGSEGGNAWASPRWKATRDAFLQKGYAFLAVGYFGCKGTPKILDQIAIENTYAAIAAARKNQKINKARVAVIGGSRGADLALLLGSYYPDITCVVGLSASQAVFPGHTQEFATSCWTFAGRQLPFVPVNEEAVPFLLKHDLRGAFTAMLHDTAATQKALIKIENIRGPILLMSAQSDEIIPAAEMGEKMAGRLKAHQFQYSYEHVVYPGSHTEPTRHFDKVFAFLATNFAPPK